MRLATLDGQLHHADRPEHERVGEAVGDEATRAEVVVHRHDALEAAPPGQGPDQHVAIAQWHGVVARRRHRRTRG